MCPRCDDERADDRDFCRYCHERLARAGLIRRLLGALGFVSREVLGVDAHVEQRVSTMFEVHDPETGRVQRYRDPDELPEFVREALEEAQQRGAAPTDTRVEVREEFRVSDGKGDVQTYRSLDELPPEIRSLIHKTRLGRG